MKRGTDVRLARWTRDLGTPRVLSAAPAAALFLVPLVMWTGFTGRRMSLGGDAGLLFFYDPWAWLTHSSTTAVSTGLSGYNAQSQFVPFCLVLRLFQTTGLNVQGVAFGSLLAMAYLGTRATCLELMTDRSMNSYCAAAAAGAVCVSAPLVAEAQLSAVLPRVLWLGLLPVLAALVLQHQRAGGPGRAVAAAVLIAVLAPAVTDVPGTIPALLTLTALVLAAWLTRTAHFHMGRVLAMGGAAVVVNVFWLVPQLLTLSQGGDQVSSATSAGGIKDAVTIVRSVAPPQSALDVAGLRQGAEFLRAFGSIDQRTEQWPRSLFPLGYLPVALVIAALVLARTQRRLLGCLAILTFTLLYLETLRVLPGGVALYVFLTQHVPGWTAVRNFYGVWPLAFVFSLSTATGLALRALSGSLLIGRLSAKLTAFAAVVLAIVLVVFDLPFYRGQVLALPYSSSIAPSRVVGALPPQFQHVLDYLAAAPPGNVLSLPLLSPAWTAVTDSPGSDLYLGISPVSYLTGRSDYDGIDSFGSALDPALKDAIRSDVASSHLRGLATVLGTVGVRYVVVNTSLTAASGYFGLQAAPDRDTEQSQTNDFTTAYAPTLLASFGPWQVRRLSVPVARAPVDIVTLPLPESANRPLSALAGPDPLPARHCDSPLTISTGQSGLVEASAGQNLEGCTLGLQLRFVPGWTAQVQGGDRQRGRVAVAGRRAADGSIAFPLPTGLAVGRQVIMGRPGRKAALRVAPGVTLEPGSPPAPLPPTANRCKGSLDVDGAAAHGTTIRATSDLAGCALVLSEAYSSQWQATVTLPDGNRAKLQPGRINRDLLRFDLPALLPRGSTVRIDYAPNHTLETTGVFSGAAAALLVAACPGAALVRRRRSRLAEQALDDLEQT